MNRPGARGSLSALCWRWSVLGCSPACPTTIRPASRPTRCSAPTTATSCCGCSLLSTVALVLFHGLAARMGVVTGQGLIGLVRQRYGVRLGGAVLAALVVANVGTTCAEFAGIAAGSELSGSVATSASPRRRSSCPLLVLRGSFHRVEHFLLLLSTVFLAYIASGVLAHPDWGAAVHGMLVPSLPSRRRGHRDRHRHRRHDARAVGALLHPVLRGRQEASDRGPLPRAGRRGHGRRAHRRHRVLRGRGLRGDAAPRRPVHPRRRRRRRRPGTPRRHARRRHCSPSA